MAGDVDFECEADENREQRMSGLWKRKVMEMEDGDMKKREKMGWKSGMGKEIGRGKKRGKKMENR